jgi:Predicted beta-xylosidase
VNTTLSDRTTSLPGDAVRSANPVWAGYMADPFAMRTSGGVYYAYGTGRPDPDTGRRFPVLRSTDLASWEYVGGALEPRPELPANADYWAPAVAERDGRFYLYYSASGGAGDDAGQRLRVALADDPAGPFRDAGSDLLPGEGFTIDAHPFRDSRDGRWYLYFARDFLDGERPGTGLAVVPLADDMVTLAGTPQTVLRASADWQIYARNRDHYGKVWDAWHTLEGPCVVEHAGLYYCLYSGGCWQNEGYGVGCAVAEHPLGPWRELGEGPTVLRGAPARGVYGPGHNSVITGPDGETDFIVYHAWDAGRTARRMCLDPLLWTENGPRCDGPSPARNIKAG